MYAVTAISAKASLSLQKYLSHSCAEDLFPAYLRLCCVMGILTAQLVRMRRIVRLRREKMIGMRIGRSSNKELI